MIFLSASLIALSLRAAGPAPVEITVNMKIDVDGAPNAYGPKGKKTLDYELNAHQGSQASGKIVGYLTKSDGRTPEIQRPKDPFPGYYISTTGFFDKNNPDRLDPRRYLDASKVNYVVLGKFAADHRVVLGDFVAVYSKKTGKSVFGLVGDSGNSSGAEGSLALLQALGYPFKNGKSGEVTNKEIVIRYFPQSNPGHQFFATQAEIDRQATALGLNKEFVSGSPR